MNGSMWNALQKAVMEEAPTNVTTTEVEATVRVETAAEAVEEQEFDELADSIDEDIEAVSNDAEMAIRLSNYVKIARMNGGIDKVLAMCMQADKGMLALINKANPNVAKAGLVITHESFSITPSMNAESVLTLESAGSALKAFWEGVKRFAASVSAWIVEFFKMLTDETYKQNAKLAALKVKVRDGKHADTANPAKEKKFKGYALRKYVELPKRMLNILDTGDFSILAASLREETGNAAEVKIVATISDLTTKEAPWNTRAGVLGEIDLVLTFIKDATAIKKMRSVMEGDLKKAMAEFGKDAESVTVQIQAIKDAKYVLSIIAKMQRGAYRTAITGANAFIAAAAKKEVKEVKAITASNESLGVHAGMYNV